EHLLLTYGPPDVRLGLSYAYLARRDEARAERQAREALSSAPLDLMPAAWTQLGRVLAYEGRTADALDASSRALGSAERYGEVPPIQAEVRSATWHMAVAMWARD